MNIRSITIFIDVSYPLDPDAVSIAGDVLHAAREALSEVGFTVQTTRLAVQPFPDVLSDTGPGKAVDLAKDLEAVAFVHEIDYIAVGPVLLNHPPTYIGVIPDILSNSENVFASVEIASRKDGLGLPRIRRVADLIRQVASLSDDGFANLRLAAIANVLPWSPFFPAAYHGGGGTRIAIATESADLVVTAVSGASSLEEIRTSLIRAIEAEAGRIETVIARVAARFDVAYQGIDFSLAPYPAEGRSIGEALERLGLPGVGGHGTLMTAAFLTDVLDRAQFTRTGFCGLMLPVLEDTALAKRAAEGVLRISDLLAFSAICGTGLDTIPLPGEVGEEVLAAILLDVAALALRLDKPLTARLMPLPGKKAGDATCFEFEYFANSRVMTPGGNPLSGLLAGDERVQIKPRSAPKD